VRTSCDIPAAVEAFLRTLYRVVLRVVRWDHRKRIRGMNQNMGWAVYGALDAAVYNAVYWAVKRAVYDAVFWAVDGAVGRAVEGAVYWAVHDDPPHPALGDFLSDDGQEAT
jgi:hypothetical protein